MPQGDYPDLFDDERQGDLFGAEPFPPIGPTPTRCGRGSIRYWRRRARRMRLLGARRGFRSIAHRPSDDRLSPEEEGAQLRFEFEQELARLKAA